VVSNSRVAEPVALRYGWADNPEVNLVNDAGLPAVPFRTDDWPGTAGAPGANLQDVYNRPEPVELPRAEAEIVVDGNLADWVDVPDLPLPYEDGRPGRVKLAWRPDGLYGAVQMAEGPPQAGDQGGFGPDCLELWVDKELERTVMMTAGTSQYVFAPAQDAGPGHARVAAGGDVYRSRRLSCAWRPTEDGYALEFHVPADLLEPAPMEPGTELGLNYTLSIDGVPEEHFYIHKDTDGSWCTPITWGLVRLAPGR
jgi:hypothetical protein